MVDKLSIFYRILEALPALYLRKIKYLAINLLLDTSWFFFSHLPNMSNFVLACYLVLFERMFWVLSWERYKKRDGLEGWKHNIVKTHIPKQVANREDNHNCRDSPLGARGLAPHQVPQSRHPALGSWVPRTSGYEGQPGLNLGSPDGCKEQILYS